METYASVDRYPSAVCRRNYFKIPTGIIIALWLLQSCDAPEQMSNSKWYYGVNYDDPAIFVSNYLYSDSLHGQWLNAPLIFKLSCGRDTMFIFQNGRVMTAPKIPSLSGEAYQWKSPNKSIIYRIKPGYVTITVGNSKPIRAIHNSMI